MFPITLVNSLSKTTLLEFPIMSTETNGSEVYSKIDLRYVSDAYLKALFISSTVGGGFDTINVKSVKLPSGTGTRMPHPPK